MEGKGTLSFIMASVKVFFLRTEGTATADQGLVSEEDGMSLRRGSGRMLKGSMARLWIMRGRELSEARFMVRRL